MTDYDSDEMILCLRCEQHHTSIEHKICDICRAELADSRPDNNWLAAWAQEEHNLLKDRMQQDPGYAPMVVREINEMLDQYAADNFITAHLKTARQNFLTRVAAIQEELCVNPN